MPDRRNFLMTIAAVLLAPTTAFAKTINRFSQGKDQLALKGFDTTAYVKSGMPLNGTDAAIVEWKGAKWRFVGAEEAASFRANPLAYAPQFGGYCTRAMSLKKEVPADPKVWRLHNDMLYVFFAPRGSRFFDEMPEEMVSKAQSNWDSLSYSK